MYTINLYLILYVRTVPCKTSDTSARTLQDRPFSVRLVIKPEFRNFIKKLI